MNLFLPRMIGILVRRWEEVGRKWPLLHAIKFNLLQKSIFLFKIKSVWWNINENYYLLNPDYRRYFPEKIENEMLCVENVLLLHCTNTGFVLIFSGHFPWSFFAVEILSERYLKLGTICPGDLEKKINASGDFWRFVIWSVALRETRQIQIMVSSFLYSFYLRFISNLIGEERYFNTNLMNLSKA